MPNTIVEAIATRILELRSEKVMLDRDLAKLYGVTVKVLNQAVKRNIKRFPDDFMFQLSWEELEALRSHFATLNSRSQFVTLKQGQNIKYLPYVFTEQGVAMLSSVLNSERAIQVNILIMRAFVRLRKTLLIHKELFFKLNELEKRIGRHDEDIRDIFEALRQLMQLPTEHRKITGFTSK
ncbi:MAG: ORF6N domain-containing protein [Candidatus Omnitrophica bacterium]|jgi:hypothetical protein|nr:ORF6N domain-containing protein [Candidatus Omnitrophota bacterium]